MKKQFSFLVSMVALSITSAQVSVPTDIVFDKNVMQAENHWVARELRNGENGLHFTYVLFDEKNGIYRLKGDGFFIIKDNIVVNDKNQFHASDMSSANNMVVKVAILNDERLKQLGLSNTQDLKEYTKYTEVNDKKMSRAIALNDMKAYEYSIPIFQDLIKNNFKEVEAYEELAFALTSVSKFQEAEQTLTQGIKVGFKASDFINSKIFLYGKWEKWKELENVANDVVKEKASTNKNKNLYNTVLVYYQAKKYEDTKRWIAIAKKEMTEDVEKYLAAFDKMEKKMN